MARALSHVYQYLFLIVNVSKTLTRMVYVVVSLHFSSQKIRSSQWERLFFLLMLNKISRGIQNLWESLSQVQAAVPTPLEVPWKSESPSGGRQPRRTPLLADLGVPKCISQALSKTIKLVHDQMEFTVLSSRVLITKA